MGKIRPIEEIELNPENIKIFLEGAVESLRTFFGIEDLSTLELANLRQFVLDCMNSYNSDAMHFNKLRSEKRKRDFYYDDMFDPSREAASRWALHNYGLRERVCNDIVEITDKTDGMITKYSRADSSWRKLENVYEHFTRSPEVAEYIRRLRDESHLI